MKKTRIISIVIVFMIILGGFGAVVNSNETDTENHCNCNNHELSKTGKALGLIKPKDWPSNARIKDIQPSETLPSSFDWRTEANGLPPARDQGGCGSCWAFGTIGTLECNIKIKDGEIVDLSEQELLSCTWYSCSGGFFVFDYLWYTGIAMEDDLVYQADDNIPCGADGPYNHVYKIDDFAQIGEGIPTDEQIKQAIYDYGPVGVCVYCDSIGWWWHSIWNPDGIYDADSNEETNHIVTLVGWNDNEGSSDPGYWILRNSWGTGFCNQGYMKFKYGICSIGEYTHYIEYSGCDLEKKTLDGDFYYESGGEVLEGDSYVVLSEGENSGWVSYRIKPDNPNNYEVEELWVGIQFRDESLWGNGPDFYIQKEGSWIKLEEGMGKPGSYTWTWRKFNNTDGYIDSDGWVYIKVAAQADDDTWIRRAGIKYKFIIPLVPDLECYGSIFPHGAVKPGAKVTGEFTVTNEGEPGSLLDWEVSDWPDWGTSWSFNPSSGNDLGKDEIVTVEVSFNAPDIELRSFSGNIEVVNKEDSSDYDRVPVTITTPRKRALFFNFIELIQNHFPLLFAFLKCYL